MDDAVLYSLSYGMYVVGAAAGEQVNAQIANTSFQITSSPKVVAVSINKENFTHSLIEKSGKFSLSIISTQWQMIDVGNFGFRSGKDFDKFAKYEYELSPSGVPLVRYKCVGGIWLDVVKKLDVHTHTIFLGEVIGAESFASDLTPMTYAYYHNELKGKEPKTAPLYRK